LRHWPVALHFTEPAKFKNIIEALTTLFKGCS
jgi:hypothetical protein